MLSCGSDSSMVWNPESFAISTSYPLGCGLGTSLHVRVTGNVSVPAFVGEMIFGGAGNGLL